MRMFWERDAGPSSLWVHNRHGYGGFAPRNATWKLQVEQKSSPRVLLQGLYENSRSAGLVELEESAQRATGCKLQGGGRAIYRQTEVSARIDRKKGQQFFLSYVHSRERASRTTSTVSWAIFRCRWCGRILSRIRRRTCRTAFWPGPLRRALECLYPAARRISHRTAVCQRGRTGELRGDA